MKILKADLPEGVRKKFVVKIGKKIKLINKNNSKNSAKKISKKSSRKSK